MSLSPSDWPSTSISLDRRSHRQYHRTGNFKTKNEIFSLFGHSLPCGQSQFAPAEGKFTTEPSRNTRKDSLVGEENLQGRLGRELRSCIFLKRGLDVAWEVTKTGVHMIQRRPDPSEDGTNSLDVSIIG